MLPFRITGNPEVSRLSSSSSVADATPKLNRIRIVPRYEKSYTFILNPMSKPNRNTRSFSLDDPLFVVKQRKAIPHQFVLDAIAVLSHRTRPMFGCLAVYVEDKIVLILRDKRDKTEDNGVWLATTEEHHRSLRREFPNMRSIQVLGKKVTGWQVLPADAPDFEEAALRACELIVARDPRIGKVPGARRPSRSAANKPKSPKPAKSTARSRSGLPKIKVNGPDSGTAASARTRVLGG